MSLSDASGEQREDFGKLRELIAQDQLEAALELYLRTTMLPPDTAAKLGKQLQKHDPVRARTWYQRVLEHQPDDQTVLEQLGRLALQAQDHAVALSCWEHLVALAPVARQFCNLASVQLALGQSGQADQSLTRALELEPELWQAHHLMAQLQLQRQDYAAALPHLRQSLAQIPPAQKPMLGARLFQLASELANQGQQALADAYLELCCQLPVPGKPLHDLYARRAACRIALLDDAGARQMYDLAATHAPQRLTYAWQRLLTLPYVYASGEHLRQERQRFEAGLEQLQVQIEAALGRGEDLRPMLNTLAPPFALAYQAHDDRRLAESLGQCGTRLLTASNYLLRTRHQPGRRIRIGVASRFLRQHPVMSCFGHKLAALAADPAFELSCIYLDAQTDAQTQWIRERAQHFLHLPAGFSPAALLDLKLDILIYPEIGLDNLSYQLALHRLAPIQIVLSGHPDTTGLPEIDYFLSDALSEPEGAERHYSETLLRLEHGIADVRPLCPPERPLSRSELGLSERAHVYFCPMLPHKLHPDFDAALAAIGQADPQARLILVQAPFSQMHEVLRQRLVRHHPELDAQLSFLPWLDTQTFHSLILEADAVLDSFHFGGGTTSRTVLSLGRPIVTWPGEFLRGRMSYGAYKRMGLEAQVPQTQDAYVAEAVKLVTDPDYRRDRREAIAARREALYTASQSLAEFKRILQLMIAHYPEKISEERGDGRGARGEGKGKRGD
ncbi:MAG TPA: hypothetical protein V6D23_18680 [Candidatus Obscuribacterales bacterium]